MSDTAGAKQAATRAKMKDPQRAEKMAELSRARMDTQKKSATLQDMVKTPAWDLFKELVEEELNVYEKQAIVGWGDAMDGVTTVNIRDANTGMSQRVPTPVDGQTLAYKQAYASGMAVGINFALDFPNRLEKKLRRQLQAEQAMKTPLKDAQGNDIKPGIDTPPYEGG